MELSGCDAAFVTVDADQQLAAKTIAYGLLLNGGATCIAPRRIFLEATCSQQFKSLLLNELGRAALQKVPKSVAHKLHQHTIEATEQGAQVIAGDPSQLLSPGADDGWISMEPIVLQDVSTHMKISQADIFAPVCSLIEFGSMKEAIEGQQALPLSTRSFDFRSIRSCGSLG